MPKSTKEYWEMRATQQEIESQLIASKYIARMDESLREAQQDILRQIEAFYARYAVDNKVTYAQAKKLLTAKEMKEFQTLDLKRFRELSLSGNPEFDHILNVNSYRVRITRLEALNAQIEMRMVELYGGVNGLQEYTNTGLAEVYQTSYLQTAYGMAQTGALVGTVSVVADKTMQELLTYNWSGREFSERIWDHQSGALITVRKELERSFASGQSLQKTTKAIMNATDVTRSRVEALVRTETNFFHGLAAQNSYQDAEMEKYQILATLDLRTSSICREQDNKIYNTKDFEPGVNANPFHVRCRTTTIPYFEDEVSGKRRSMDGLVDNMTYQEWYDGRVVGQSDTLNKEKMIQFKSSDKAQLKKYQEAKVKDAPRSLEAFQKMKYGKDEKYDALMKAYRGR